MDVLCDSKVFSWWRLTEEFNYETDNISISVSRTLTIEFSIPSKGDGSTCIDRHTAMRAMSSELQRQIVAQPEFDERNASAVRVDLLNLAFDRSISDKDAEDLDYGMYFEMKKLVDEVERG
jgi:hypothetical protein